MYLIIFLFLGIEFLKWCGLVLEDEEEERISFKRIVFFLDFEVKLEFCEYIEKGVYISFVEERKIFDYFVD